MRERKKSEVVSQKKKKKKKGKQEKERSVHQKWQRHHCATHRFREELQGEVGEENAQSNDWEFLDEEKFKNQGLKLKFSGKPKGHTIGALIPLIRTCHVVTSCVAPPLCI